MDNLLQIDSFVSTDINSEIVSNCEAVLGGTVIPGISYACVVGEVAHPGPIPVKTDKHEIETEEAWWNVSMPLPSIKVKQEDSDDECPEAESLDGLPITPPNTPVGVQDDIKPPQLEFSVDVKPEVSFGFQLGMVFATIPEVETAEIIQLHHQLAMTSSVIQMLERFPMETRPDMGDLYLMKLRLQDKIEFLTPAPPPYKIEEVESTIESEEVSLNEWATYGTTEPKWQQVTKKSKRKRENRKARAKKAKMKSVSDTILINAAIRENFAFTQSGFVKPQPSSVVARNICLLSQFMDTDEVASILRRCDLSRPLTAKSLQRLRREVIQIRSAREKMREAMRNYDHQKAKISLQAERRRQREDKFADSQGFGEFISVASKVLSIATVAVGTVSTFHGARTVTKKASNLLDEITMRIKELGSRLGKLGDAVKNSILAALILFLFLRFKHVLIRTAVLAAIPLVFSGDIRKCIFDFFQREDVNSEVATQAGLSDDADLLPGLVSVGLLTTCGFKSKHGMLPGLIDSVGKLPRTITGVETLVDFAVKATEKGLNVILRWCNRPEVSFRKPLDLKVDAAIKAAHAIDLKMNSPEFKNNESPQMYHTCMESYAELTTLMAMHHENIKIKQAISPYRAMMGAHCGTLRNTLGRGAGFRQEPLSVVIESSPGVGKTMNMPALIGTVLFQAGLMSELTPDKLSQAYFTRPANSDFFDGYHGQECYFIDDIFSRKPNLNGITQFDEVMAFYGTTTTMLNMAALEQKGMYPFTSSLLLMTTNLKCLTQIGADAFLLEPKAFERRVDIHVHIEVRPEYALTGARAGQLDYSKYEAEVKKLNEAGKTGRDCHPWYMWECWDTHFAQGLSYPAGTGRCFSQVVDEIIDGLKQKTTNHEANMAHLANIFKQTPDVATTQSGGEIIADSVSVELGASAPVTPIRRHFPRYSSFISTPSLDAPLMCSSRDVSVKGKPDTNKNVIHRSISVDSDSDPNWTKSMKAEQVLQEAIAGFLIGIGVYMIWRAVLRPFLSGLLGFISGSEKTLTGETQSNERKEVRVIKAPSAAVIQQTPDFGLWKKVYDQTFKMVISVNDGSALSPFGQVLFIDKNLCVMPHHFLDQLSGLKKRGEVDANTIITFFSCGDTGKVKMTVEAFESFPSFSIADQDLHFIHFKKNFRMYKNIIGMVMPEARLADVGGRSVRLDTATVSSPDGVLLPAAIRITYNSDRVQLCKTTLRTNTGRSYNRYLSYSASTTAGDCGAPLCLIDYRHFKNAFLVGLHVAGMPDQGLGYSTILTQEACNLAKSKFEGLNINYTELTPEESGWTGLATTQSIDCVPFTVDGKLGNTRPVCVVNEKVSIPVRSSKVKTFMGRNEVFKDAIIEMNEGRVPPKLVPMRLGRYTDQETGEDVFPMEQALAPYVDEVFVPVDGSFKIGLASGLKAFADATMNYNSPVLTPQVAILGDPLLGLKSITRSTSVGYPLGLKADDKKYFFGSDELMDVTTPEAIKFIANVEDLVVKLKDSKRPFFVCRDFLKDEVRKVGKKARLIAGTDLTYYVLNRMYFGAFVGAVSRSHAKSGICLGTNPYAEWGGLRTILEKPDPTGVNVWDGDFAGFDSSQMPQLLWDCLDYINNWYFSKAKSIEEQNKVRVDNTVRTMLFLDLVYSKHLTSYHGPAETVIEWVKSLPSGHFLTSTINSMLSLGLVASGYVALTGRTDFWDTSAAVVLGDDNVVSTSVDYVHQFNQVTLADYLLKAFGMVYTAGRKGEALQPVIGIDDVVFLQRRFAVKNGRDVCPIRPESFLHSLYYVQTKDEKEARKTLLAGLELAFEELSMHDDAYWPSVSLLLSEQKAILGETPQAAIMTSDDYFMRVQKRVPSYI